jgi:glucan biosynthesis protein C
LNPPGFERNAFLETINIDLVESFATATRLEAVFWDMGLDAWCSAPLPPMNRDPNVRPIMRNQSKIRYHGLDFLRAFAMLLGLAVHAPLIYYMPEVARSFGVEDAPAPELWVDVILVFITSWRMPMFFLLSGFFAVLLIERRGLSGFLNDRLIRIGMTFVLFAALFDFFDGTFDGTLDHLWFLYYLLIFIFVIALAFQFSSVKKQILRKIPAYRAPIAGGWLIMAMPVATILNGESIEAPYLYSDVQTGSLLYYGSYFCAGLLLYGHKSLLEMLSSLKAISILTPITLLVFIFYLDFLDTSRSFGPASVLNPPSLSLGLLLAGLNSFLWVVLLMGLAGRFVRSGSKTLNWLVELSYPIYLFHLHPVLFISAALYVEGIDQFPSFILSMLAGFGICVVLYYVLVKFTPLNWLLNGYKKSWLKLRF